MITSYEVPQANLGSEATLPAKAAGVVGAAEIPEAPEGHCRSIVVVLAHPDDESFPIGGTLARYAAQGSCITLVCATRGEEGIPGVAPDEAGRLRERELRLAALTLGVASVEFLGYRDGELSRVDGEEATARLVKAIQIAHPDAVITFGADGISGHPDHVAVHHLTTEAFRRAELPPTSLLYYILPSEATRQGCGVIPAREVAGGPVASIDVREYRVTKIRAMQCHRSQNPPYAGDPAEEATRLVCHEYFTLAHPAFSVDGDLNFTDLFGPLGLLNSVEQLERSEPRLVGVQG